MMQVPRKVGGRRSLAEGARSLQAAHSQVGVHSLQAAHSQAEEARTLHPSGLESVLLISMLS